MKSIALPIVIQVLHQAALAVALAGAMTAAHAAAPTGATPSVWRCGAEGRLYSDVPCAAGRELDVADPRSAEQVAQARQVLAADQRRAEAMKRERLERERLERAHMATRPGALSASAGAAPVKKTALRESGQKPTMTPSAKPPKSKKSRPADEGTWRAVAPASPQTPG